jgi:hypothetical protein
VTVTVLVIVGVTVGVTEAVGVIVGVTVFVIVGVSVGVTDGVCVGVGVNSAEQTTLTSSRKLPKLVAVVELNIRFKLGSGAVKVTYLKSH